MAELTNKMGLAVWDNLLDLYNYLQLADNWNKVDFHDHTPGRGVPIPYGGLAPGAVGTVNLASDVGQTPTGAVLMWTVVTPPMGYLACDGASYLRTDYAALFGVVGTTYGTADSLHFNVPLLSVSPAYGFLGFIIKT